jgi:hypothetical protein
VYILLAAILAAVFGVAWWIATGSTHLPWPAVVGLALAAGAIANLTEKTIHRLRRSRPERRAHAR